MFKRLFNKFGILHNQKGSSLSTAIIVVAVLAFSVTTITRLTITLSGTTTTILENVNDEADGKGLITKAINDFEIYIEAGNSYDDYNTTQIPAVFTSIGVIVTDETDNFPDFGEGSGNLTKVYKFAYPLSQGDTIYKYVYVSSAGSTYETYHPFDFSIGTEGDLILNGGYYEDIKMFGNNIYVSDAAPWTEDDLTFLPISDHLTPYSSASYPVFTDSGFESQIFVGNTYQYCTSNCFSVTSDSSNPYVIDKSNYVDVNGGSLSDTGDIQPDHIISFFNNFDFEDFVVEYATQILPTSSRTISGNVTLANLESVIRANMDTRSGGQYPNTPYVDVTNDSRYTPWRSNESINYGYAYDGDLTIANRHIITDYDDEGLVVLGDLHITNDSDNNTERIRGTYLVTGDLYLDGYSNDFNRATFIVLGQVFVNYIYGYEINTWSNNYELSIIAMDNIIIDGTHENYGTADPDPLTALLYSEESIFIDAVESKFQIEGAIFARAAGNSGNYLNIEDELGNPIQGIVINSYQGYVSKWYEWDWNTWEWVKDIDYIPSNNDNDHRFYISPVDASDFQNTFMNIPAYSGVTVSDGEFTFEKSEWKIE